MGNTDSLPGVSQVKSGVQLVCGDTDGAAKTQENFFRECPVVSQLTSVGQVLAGDVDGAVETQKRCGKGLLNMADGLPVVGHAKGLVHYAVGDKEGGHKAMKAATRTTGVMGGGVAGFFVGGPVVAVLGGMEGGAVMDFATTIVTGTNCGYVAAIDNVRKNPNAGDIFDLAMTPVFDGLAGHSAGQVAGKIAQANAAKANAAKASAMEASAFEIFDKAEALHDNGLINEGEFLKEAKASQNLFDKAQKLQGKPQSGHSISALKDGSAGKSVPPTGVTAPQPTSAKTTESQKPQATQQSGGDDERPQKRIPPPREHYMEINPTQFSLHETVSLKYTDQNGVTNMIPLTKRLHVSFPVNINESHGRAPQRQSGVSLMIDQMNREEWDQLDEAGIGSSESGSPIQKFLPLQFIRGHLQSRSDGGLGDTRNIVPMTRSLNALFETRFESFIKQIRREFQARFRNSSAVVQLEFRVYYIMIRSRSGRQYPYAHKLRVNVSLGGGVTEEELAFFKKLMNAIPDFVLKTSRTTLTYVIRFWNRVRADVGNREDFPYSSETVERDEQEESEED